MFSVNLKFHQVREIGICLHVYVKTTVFMLKPVSPLASPNDMLSIFTIW